MKSNTNLILSAGLLLGLGFVIYFPVWQALFHTWSTSDDYSHGFFMVPAAVYLLYLRREKLASIPLQPSKIGLAILLLSLTSYIFFYYAEVKTGAALSMLCTIIGTTYYLFGLKILKEITVPLLLLLFMIPIPEQIYTSITVPLQLLVSQISTWLSMAVGIPIFREGNVIHLPDHTLEVVEACSGIRSLVSLLALSLLISNFGLRSNLLRSILFLSSVPAAIIVNIFRVLIMIAAFYFFDYDITAGTVHTVIGILIFILSLTIILLFRTVLVLWDKKTTH